jgi:hypothetical protein
LTNLDLFESPESLPVRPPKTWLVGEHNPYGADSYYALYPAPDGSAGARLCDFLDLTRREYLRRFERRNLLSSLPWSAKRAREAAAALRAELVDGDCLVLLGAKVARAFGYDFEILKKHREIVREDERGGGFAQLVICRVLVAPHPSGLSRAWNDPTMPARLRAALEDLERPSPDALSTAEIGAEEARLGQGL